MIPADRIDALKRRADSLKARADAGKGREYKVTYETSWGDRYTVQVNAETAALARQMVKWKPAFQRVIKVVEL